MTSILGISAFYHDSAACLIMDGQIIAAAQEERFTRKKHDASFPHQAAAWCLREGGLEAAELDLVGFYEKPLLKFERLLETYVAFAPAGFGSFVKAMPVWMKEKLWLSDIIRTEMAHAAGIAGHKEARKAGEQYPFKLLFGDHHESHAASAFYPSPFNEAAILTMDGVGEWATSTCGIGRGSEITMLEELRFPASVGLLYSAFTHYTGFRVNSGEYKVMGLAPYGEPRYAALIREKLVDIRDDGSIRLNQEYFGYATSLHMTNDAFHRLFGEEPRKPESPLRQRDLDLARSIQDVTQEIMLKMATHAKSVTGMNNLCLAGGVALNCVGNGRILREGPFEHVWIQPAAGDAGGALGVALALWHRYLDKPRPDRAANSAGGELPCDGMKGAYLGPRSSEEEIERFLQQSGARYHRIDAAELPDLVASQLVDERIIGLHHGRMEFGPRALGARSIIGDARSPRMQSVMNLKIKFRESFRPFAPSVLRERAAEWFELEEESPYMLLVADVRKERRRQMTAAEEALWGIEKLNVVRSDIPAVTHVDYSARVQTVSRDTNEFYWSVIEAFRQRTGCPVIVNTSFNVRGEPIVCTPQDSFRCFMRTDIDVLVLESFVLYKSEQSGVTGDWSLGSMESD